MSSPTALTPVAEVIEFLARAPSRKAMAAFQLSPSAHERLRVLLDRNAAGTLTEAEAHELDQMVVLDDILSLLKARAQGFPDGAE
jgi:hypothetical protein